LYRVKANDAIELYAVFFDKTEILQSTCKEFTALAVPKGRAADYRPGGRQEP